MEKLTIAMPLPTADRPLLGATVLAVEDSRSASDALRLLCIKSGARIRRADCLVSARRHLMTYRPTIAIVDLGLPDGNGLDLIASLHNDALRPHVILGTSGDLSGSSHSDAMAAGANGFLAKPIESIGSFQEMILSHLPQHAQPRWLRPLDTHAPDIDPIAYRDDLSHAADLLETEHMPLHFVGQFLHSVAKTRTDTPLLDLARSLSKSQPKPEVVNNVKALLAERLNKQHGASIKFRG